MTTYSINRRRVVVFGAGLAAAAGLAGCSTVLGSFGSSTHAGRRTTRAAQPLAFDAAEGLAAVNRIRGQYGMAAFSRDPRLQQAAQKHAEMMARTGNYGHDIGPGTKFPTRLAAVGFDGSAGENLGVGYGSVDEAIQGWLDSPKHRKILLRRNYDRAGLAYGFNRSGRNPRYTHYWVLIVGEDARRAPAMRPV